MSQITKRILFLVCLLLVTSPAFAQRSRLSSGLPSRQMLSRYGLEQAWWSQATINPQRDRVRYISVDEENVYIQSRSGMVTAFDNENGKILWSSLLGRFDSTSFPLATNGEIAMVVTGMEIYAVDKFTGKVLWNLHTPSAPSTSPAIDGNHVYVGFLDGSVYAFDLKKTRELYSKDRLRDWSFQAVAWRYATGKEISTPPLSNGRVVNFASRDGSLYTVSADERKIQYQFETDAPISAPIGERGQYLFLASEDYNFFCIDRDTGRVQWEFVSGLPVRKKPLIFDNEVYLMPVRGGIYCLTADEGEQEWWRPEGTELLAATPKKLYTSDRSGNIVMLSRENGSIQGAFPLRHFNIRLANDRTDRLYMATEDGLVISIREKGRKFPLYHKHPELRPIVPEFVPEEDPSTENTATDGGM